MTGLVWLIAIALVLAQFAVLSRVAIDAFSLPDVEAFLRKAGRTKIDLPKVERFAEHLSEYRFTFRLLSTLAITAGAAGILALAGLLIDDRPALVWVWFAMGLGLFVMLADTLIRPIAEARAESLTLLLIPLWRVLHGVCYLPLLPFRAALWGVEYLVSTNQSETNSEEDADEEIMAAVAHVEYQGKIEEEERDMIESILALDDLSIDKIMTPRTDMVAVNVTEGTEGVLAAARESGHSRLPVFDDNRDNIIGVCYVKDLIGYTNQTLPDVQVVMRKPFMVPVSKRVSDVLREMRVERVHIGIVLDEYGGTAGLVTIEDIVEEVFGEIDDEYDEVRDEDVRRLEDASLDLDAKMRVEEVNERFDMNLPESDHYESLGGLLTSNLGCIPAAGDIWQEDNCRLTVLEATDRRVVRVRLERVMVNATTN